MGEKHIIEYKRQWDDEWLKWICGFANADGGTHYIGIIANAFYMAGFVEAWGRGFELIAEAFKANGLEVPTLLEAQGGIRVIIKRELFYGIQQGGRIDPKTGRLIQADDTKNDTNDVTKK